MNIFPKRQWSKWQHVMFYERYTYGNPVYELLQSKCELTGLTRYKKVRITSIVHQLTGRLNVWLSNKNDD